MKLTSATLYALKLPFVETFAHAATARAFSDSIVVKVRDESGIEGFGEGAPRPYVTGESQGSAVRHLADVLWPSIAGRALELPGEPGGEIPEFVPDARVDGAISDGAARCALELAVLDAALRRKAAPMARLVPPRRSKVTYSGVITAGSLQTLARTARQMRMIGIHDVKVKVGQADDVERVALVRQIMGPDASIRVDANGAWDFDGAVRVIRKLAAYGVVAVEQPIARTSASELAMLARYVPIALMADESLVTVEDARRLIQTRAVGYFNIRVSKCGGMARSRRIAELAQKAGVRIQIGSQVGETAILSAAGRHLAAGLASVEFVEGSYGTMLLAEDVTPDPVRFGHRGEAPVLNGPGLGVRVDETRLRKYSEQIIELT